MVEDIPIIGDVYGWFKGQAGELFKIVGFDVFIDMFKEAPKILSSLVELLLMTDDIVALGVKIIRFLFGDLMDLAIIFIENLITRAEPIMDFVFSAVKALEETKEIPSIIVYGSPMFLALYLLYFIVNSI